MKKGTLLSALIPKYGLYVTLVSDTVYHDDHVPP